MNHVSKETYQKEVLSHQGRVLVDFYASWCGPCRVMEPVLEKFSERYKDVKIAKVNIDEQHELSQEVDVMSIPTFVLYENGKEKSRVIGSRSLTMFTKELLANEKESQ